MTNLEDYLHYYKATVKLVHDGDTITVDWHLGRGEVADEKFRFSRINAYELKDPSGKGIEAQKYVSDRILNKDIIIKSQVDTKGEDKQEKYGRYLAEIFYKDSTGNYVNLNDELVAQGLAVIYS